MCSLMYGLAAVPCVAVRGLVCGLVCGVAFRSGRWRVILKPQS